MKNTRKIRLALETHRYAPELNKLHVIVNGVTVKELPAGGVTDFVTAKKRYFRATDQFIRYAEMHISYENPEYAYLTQVRKGRINNFRDLLKIKRELLKAKNIPGEKVVCKIKTRTLFN